MEDIKFKSLLDEARGIVETAIAEGREMTTEEREKSVRMYEEAKGRMSDKQLQAKIDELEAKGFAPEPKEEEKQFQDVGSRFIQSEHYKSWMKQVAPNGRIPDSAKGLNSPTVPISLPLEQKALITGLSDTSAGAFIEPDRFEYQAMGRPPLTIRDLISVRQTGSDTIEWVRQTKQITEATPVAEATDLTDGLKPEGAITWAKVSTPVQTIAVWIPATKQAVSDAKQLRGIINQELYEALDQELETQIMTGNGTSPNFTGLGATTGVLTQAFTTDIYTTARNAITNLGRNGLERPTAYMLSPEDWATAELAFYQHAPYLPRQRSMWGIPVVESFGLTAGTGWLANWKKAVLWDREQATISMTDSHADFFIRNLIAVLAELRAAFAVVKPQAFVKMTLSGG